MVKHASHKCLIYIYLIVKVTQALVLLVKQSAFALAGFFSSPFTCVFPQLLVVFKAVINQLDFPLDANDTNLTMASHYSPPGLSDWVARYESTSAGGSRLNLLVFEEWHSESNVRCDEFWGQLCNCILSKGIGKILQDAFQSVGEVQIIISELKATCYSNIPMETCIEWPSEVFIISIDSPHQLCISKLPVILRDRNLQHQRHRQAPSRLRFIHTYIAKLHALEGPSSTWFWYPEGRFEVLGPHWWMRWQNKYRATCVAITQ